MTNVVELSASWRSTFARLWRDSVLHVALAPASGAPVPRRMKHQHTTDITCSPGPEIQAHRRQDWHHLDRVAWWSLMQAFQDTVDSQCLLDWACSATSLWLPWSSNTYLCPNRQRRKNGFQLSYIAEPYPFFMARQFAHCVSRIMWPVKPRSYWFLFSSAAGQTDSGQQ